MVRFAFAKVIVGGWGCGRSVSKVMGKVLGVRGRVVRGGGWMGWMGCGWIKVAGWVGGELREVGMGAVGTGCRHLQN